MHTKMVRTPLLGRTSGLYVRSMAIVRQPSVWVPRGSPTDAPARSYRDGISGPLSSEATARRITAGDGELLRWLMLAATQVPSRSVEHRVLEARSSTEWDRLAADRATSDRRAIFVLAAPGAATGEALVSCSIRRGAVADVGCWWIHRPAEDTPEERSLLELVAAWAAERGATTIVAAADDQREQASLVRAGFVHRRVASDAHRPVLTRRTTAPALVD